MSWALPCWETKSRPNDPGCHLATWFFFPLWYLIFISSNKGEGKQGNESFPVLGELLVFWCWAGKDLTQNHQTIWLSAHLISSKTVSGAVLHVTWFISSIGSFFFFSTSLPKPTLTHSSALCILCSYLPRWHLKFIARGYIESSRK